MVQIYEGPCKSRGKNAELVKKVCRFCGKTGHWGNECPTRIPLPKSASGGAAGPHAEDDREREDSQATARTDKGSDAYGHTPTGKQEPKGCSGQRPPSQGPVYDA